MPSASRNAGGLAGGLGPAIVAALTFLVAETLLLADAAAQTQERLAPKLRSTLDEMVERPDEPKDESGTKRPASQTRSSPSGPPPSIDGPEEVPNGSPRTIPDEAGRSPFAEEVVPEEVAPP